MPEQDWTKFGPSVAGAAANLGMNLLGNSVSGLINNLFYRRNLDLQVKAQKELMDYQNAYNSPSAQMQRLQEAGLNPNLVYGSAAPAGQSGNASAPSGVANAGASFFTPDIVANALHAQQMEQSESMIEVNKALAEKYRAEAVGQGLHNERYNEQVDTQISEANARINKLASDINLNASSIQLNSAKKMLALADEEYRRGQISLQKYERQVLIAQSTLYTSDAELKNTQKGYFGALSRNVAVDTLLKRTELKYNRIMQSPYMAQKEKQARLKALEKQFAADSAQIGIVGSKSVQWTNQAFKWLGSAAGSAAAIGVGFSGVGKGMQLFGAGANMLNYSSGTY